MRWNDNGTIRDNSGGLNAFAVEEALRTIDGVAGVLQRLAGTLGEPNALDAPMFDMLANVLLDGSATVAQFIGAAEPAPER